jgi:ArsR family transcriptional regulator, virulence genes transcriptional regulator
METLLIGCIRMTNLQGDSSIEYFAEQQADFCRIFSNSRRVQIFWVLIDRELSVGAIAEAVGSSLQNVSQHLSKMKEHNIVSSRREGQTIYYRIESEALADRCSGLIREKFPKFKIPIHNKEKLNQKE